MNPGIIIVVLLVALGGFAGVKVKQNDIISKPTPFSNVLEISPTLTLVPTVYIKPVINSARSKPTQNYNCTGPDGKQFTTTEEECKKFNNAWGNSNNRESINISNNQQNKQVNVINNSSNQPNQQVVNINNQQLTPYPTSKPYIQPTLYPTPVKVDYYFCSTTVADWCRANFNNPSYNEKCSADKINNVCPSGGSQTIAGNVKGLENLGINDCVCVR